jgi:hypothetical protein
MRSVLQRLLSQPTQDQSTKSVKQLLDSIDRIENTVSEDVCQEIAQMPHASQLPDVIFGTVAVVVMSQVLPVLRRIICHALGFKTYSYSDAMFVKSQLNVWY